MVTLGEFQVDLIDDLLMEKGVYYEDLRTDLLDHICCLVEDLMANGRDFNEALSETMVDFEEEELHLIQETTIYALNQKKNQMKKVSGILGMVTSALVIAGVLFKVNHWPGAGIMLVLGIALTALAVFPMMAFISYDRKASLQRRMTVVLGWLSAVLLSAGTMFKIMHWPGANILLISGFVMITFGFMPLYMIGSYKTSENKVFALAKSMLIVAGIAVFWGLYPRNRSVQPKPAKEILERQPGVDQHQH